jgi:hypothetical protein
LNDEQNSVGLKQEVIEVISYPLRDGGYTVHFFLERYGRDILVTHFESEQRFDTDEEALSAGVKLVQRQIDIGYDGTLSALPFKMSMLLTALFLPTNCSLHPR